MAQGLFIVIRLVHVRISNLFEFRTPREGNAQRIEDIQRMCGFIVLDTFFLLVMLKKYFGEKWHEKIIYCTNIKILITIIVLLKVI